MPVVTDRLSLSVCLLFVDLYLSIMPDRPSARPCLLDKVLRRYPIRCDQDLEIQIYFSATSYCLDSNKCVRLTDTRDTKLRSVVLYTRRDQRVQHYVWCWRVPVQGYEKRPVLRLDTEEVASRLSSSWRHAPADVLMSCSCRRLHRLDITRRRPDVAFLSLSPTSWRHVRVAVQTSRSCRRLRRLDVTLLPTSWRLVPVSSSSS